MRPSQHLRQWLPVIALAPLTSLVAPAAIAQQVLEGLPPPPALPPADQYSAPAGVSVPGVAPAPAQPQAAPTRSNQVRSNQPIPSQRVVVVYGDSPLLLNQVQQVVPTASLQEFRGQRVIYVGTFNNDGELRNQVMALRSQGIEPEVLQMRPNEVLQASAPGSIEVEGTEDLLPVTQVPREVVFGQQPTFDNATSAPTTFAEPDNRAYFIVVPGDRSELDAIGNQIIRLGQGFAIAQLVEERGDRRGNHVRVGPFANRGAAERWNRYLRDFGMDARVYYRR